MRRNLRIDRIRLIMQKINVSIIFRDHLSTLIDDRTGRLQLSDFALFYFAPIFAGLVYYFRPFELPESIESALIAVFSVFGALLFSAQVALYTLSPASENPHADKILRIEQQERHSREVKYFRDINYNVSYLILLSCLFLILFIGLMVMNPENNIKGGILIASVSHFFLSLLMLVKRTHVAFALRHSSRD